MFEIIPGILEKEWNKIEEKLESLKGLVKTVQIDVIDGKFTDSQTFLDPMPFSKYKDDFLLEAHFIVDEPINYLDSFARSGFKRFIGHIEKMSDQEEFIAKGEILGEVGLAIDLDTKLDEIKIDLFDLDCLTIMTVKAGASGQEFSKDNLGKVKELVEKFKENPLGKKLPIEIDGGIKEETILLAKDAGVDRFIVNSYLFNGDIRENLNKIRLLLS
jgi:ribulose-phosphate 3-epimerase